MKYKSLKAIFLLIVLCLPCASYGVDENWMNVVVKTTLSQKRFLLVDYVRRDLGDGLFQDKFRDLLRASYGLDYDSFSIILGGAYADFENLPMEYRIFQQGIYKIKSSTFDLSGIFRLGLEQRKFEDSDHWYSRARAKFLLTPFNSKTIAPVIYSESFWGFDGKDRFKNGFNENRSGFGLRILWEKIETYLFWVNTKTQDVHENRMSFEWLQVQVNFNF